MAHELDVRSNGTAAMFSVIETPWHKLGTILAAAPSFRDALELGGLDFDVELRPLTTTFEIAGGDSVEIAVPDHRAVVRTDRMNADGVLGCVGSSYHVLQNRDGFSVLEPLLDAGVASLETGGALRGGRDVWMMVRFNIDNARVREVLGDEVLPFGLISNNHDGSRQVTLKNTPIRVVCANTLGMALRRGTRGEIKVRHTANVASRTVDAARELFASLTADYVEIANQFEAMKSRFLSQEEFTAAVLDVLAPLPAAPKERKDNIAKAAQERATARAMEKRNRLSDLWVNGDGHTGDCSAWEAMNGAVQSLDHDEHIWKADDRIASLFDGTLATAKTQVTNSVYALCK